jgi:hypothetical protein
MTSAGSRRRPPNDEEVTLVSINGSRRDLIQRIATRAFLETLEEHTSLEEEAADAAAMAAVCAAYDFLEIAFASVRRDSGWIELDEFVEWMRDGLSLLEEFEEEAA